MMRTTQGPADGRRPAAGFTLAEMLVALVLLGLISVALVGGIRFGTRAWESSTLRSAQIERMVSAQTFLRRQISQAVLPAFEDPEAGASFVGEAERLRFTAPWLSPVGAGGLYVFEVDMPQEGDRRDLRVRWALRHPEWSGTFDPESKNERVLLEDIEGLSLRYFGDPELADEPDWQSDWDEPFFMPRLIEMKVDFASGSSRAWPTLSVAPQSLSTGR